MGIPGSVLLVLPQQASDCFVGFSFFSHVGSGECFYFFLSLGPTSQPALRPSLLAQGIPDPDPREQLRPWAGVRGPGSAPARSDPSRQVLQRLGRESMDSG